MDNVTHGLIGYALAKTVLGRHAPSADAATVRAFVWTGVVASNLPDADLLLSPLLDDRKLGYLLHHRGHTHTLLYALPLGLFCAWLFAKLCGYTPTPELRGRLPLLGLLSAALHLLFDGFNNYGVHPFHPLHDGWFYGDFIFIIEPLLLCALLAFTFVDARARWGKGLIGLLALVLFWLVFTVGAVPQLVGAGILLFGLSQLALQLRSARRKSWLLSSMLGVLLLFALGSRHANARVQETLAAAFPNERVLDVVRTPLPGNPVCWNVLAITAQASTYRVRFGSVSALPSLASPEQCRNALRGPTTAPLEEQPLALAPDLQLRLSYTADRAQLSRLRREHCLVHAALRFMRAPFWKYEGEQVVIGDLRYDNEESLGFAELSFPRQAPAHCPRFIPPWTPPRADLL